MNSFNTPGYISRNSSYFNNKSNDTGLQRYYDALVSAEGSISIFNHPGPTFGDFGKFGYYTPKRDNRIQMIEVGNGEGAVGSGGYFRSLEYYFKTLDKGWHVAPVNNQDNHQGKWGVGNAARSVVLADDLSQESMYDSMRSLRVYSTEHEKTEIDFRMNGHVMGTQISGKPETMDFTAKIVDRNDAKVNISKVSLVVSGGKEIATQSFASDYIITLLQLRRR